MLPDWLLFWTPVHFHIFTEDITVGCDGQTSWVPLLGWGWLRGLHGLKTEARTRPVPEIVWPDPTRAAQLNLEPEPDPKSPPPHIRNKKKKEKDCISRLHAKKRINQGSAISQTFMKVCEHQVQRSHTFCRVYEFCLDKKMMTVQIMVIFCQLRLVSILSTLNQT